MFEVGAKVILSNPRSRGGSDKILESLPEWKDLPCTVKEAKGSVNGAIWVIPQADRPDGYGRNTFSWHVEDFSRDLS